MTDLMSFEQEEEEIMEKKQTTVYLLEEIRSFCKKNKINLSEWINAEFSKQYLSLDSKLKRLRELKIEIDEINERIDRLSKNLTSREIKHIYTVVPRLRNGYKMESMWRLFNNKFNREYNFSEFEAVVEYYEMKRR